jgi:hypothetical protein
MKKTLLAIAITVVIASVAIGAAPLIAARPQIRFGLVPSTGAVGCLPSSARGEVTIKDFGTFQKMHIVVDDLPPKTQFTVFVIQVPNKPFGLVWYQGDVETNHKGHGVANFAGIFSIETFIMAPGVAPAPKIFDDDATINPVTPPVQTYHLGMWFADPTAATVAGCPDTVTPFDGDHVAGIQVLNTSSFPDDHGPLLDLQ